MRRASYEYPLAYGRGYKTFPISKIQVHAQCSRTFAVGEHSRLHAGLIATHIDTNRTTIDFLFRFRRTRHHNIGKVLLKHYLEHCLHERDYDEVGLEVVSNNTPARKLYEDLGFVVDGVLKGSGHKLLSMELPSRFAIQQAITHLNAFSV